MQISTWRWKKLTSIPMKASICSATKLRVPSFRKGMWRTQSSPLRSGRMRKNTKKSSDKSAVPIVERYLSAPTPTFTAETPYVPAICAMRSWEKAAGSVKNLIWSSGTPSDAKKPCACGNCTLIHSLRRATIVGAALTRFVTWSRMNAPENQQMSPSGSSTDRAIATSASVGLRTRPRIQL